jgi:hypothetical protein
MECPYYICFLSGGRERSEGRCLSLSLSLSLSPFTIARVLLRYLVPTASKSNAAKVKIAKRALEMISLDEVDEPNW